MFVAEGARAQLLKRREQQFEQHFVAPLAAKRTCSGSASISGGSSS
ncbi:MAG: hypothetical protein IPH03_02085 [Tetrasphaera sp.]|nr:hypothetical protein [Tetrasphaera sp.]